MGSTGCSANTTRRAAKVKAFKAACKEVGIFGLARPPLIHTAPPLTITEAGLDEGIMSLCLPILVYT
jgi:hypothetical protein